MESHLIILHRAIPNKIVSLKRLIRHSITALKHYLPTAKLSPILWDEAIIYACILYNLNPHQRINF